MYKPLNQQTNLKELLRKCSHKNHTKVKFLRKKNL